MKKFLTLLLLLPVLGHSQFKNIVKKATETVKASTSSGADISAGLKQALNKGVSNQVVKLTATDGFYKNEAVKILLPEELQKVDKALRQIGMQSLADDGIRALNRAAEDAVKEATPIFVDAIKDMTVEDGKKILMGNENAATSYLQQKTTAPLYVKFNPVVKNSIGKVGADKIWATIITKYNALPLVKKVNPDINDYVTTKALQGVFTMIAVEERNIRENPAFRTTDILKKVFSLQDRK